MEASGMMRFPAWDDQICNAILCAGEDAGIKRRQQKVEKTRAKSADTKQSGIHDQLPIGIQGRHLRSVPVKIASAGQGLSGAVKY